MTPLQQSYLPAIAEHAKEWVYWNEENQEFHWESRVRHGDVRVFTTELLQLMQWIEEKEGLHLIGRHHDYSDALMDITYARWVSCQSAHWHERWLAICQVKGWKTTL